MTEDQIGYAELIDNAMRGVVRDTLLRISDHGLPGEHHCYISFKTHYPGVGIADYLKERYPDEMTIVLQHQYWDLDVDEDGFSIVLSFNRTKEPLAIPYDALTAFADPSIKFGLQFQHKESEEYDDDQHSFGSLLDNLAEDDGTIGGEGAKVIALDTFRNNKNDS